MKDSFLAHIQRAKEAAQQQPKPAGPKPPEEMTEAERAEEMRRLEWEKTKAEIKAIAIGRQEAGEAPSAPRRRASIFGHTPRRPFK